MLVVRCRRFARTDRELTCEERQMQLSELPYMRKVLHSVEAQKHDLLG